MNQLLLLGIIALPLLSCSDKPHQEQVHATEIKKDSTDNKYSDSGQSTFSILAVDSNSGYEFKTIETNYKTAFLDPDGDKNFDHYIAKYTTTTQSCTGCEQQERTIRAELNSFSAPKKTILTLEQKCDELLLDATTYKTTKFGCCGAADHFEIYNYENKLVAEGDGKITIGEIPNSPIKIYAGYTQETKDSTFIGTLHYSYNSDDTYAIRIQSNKLPLDECNIYSPNIMFQSRNPRDKYDRDENQFTFWSLDKLEDTKKINQLSLKVDFECEPSLKVKALEIPIINGKPFGKDERVQLISLGHK